MLPEESELGLASNCIPGQATDDVLILHALCALSMLGLLAQRQEMAKRFGPNLRCSIKSNDSRYNCVLAKKDNNSANM